MKEFIDKLRNKSIHVVGVTGAEGSSILRFLIKHKIFDITVHDFSPAKTLEKSFNLWHKGLSARQRGNLYQQFKNDLTSVNLRLGTDYLKNIDKADLIFVPQSWRLYSKENTPLKRIFGKIPFYSLTRLYLDEAMAKIVAVTGTVGKGSTANIIYQLLKKNLLANRQVYFAGNETWMIQLADKLDEMKGDDILILEISHRQLQDGFTRAPFMTVFTNLYPNHLNEVSWNEYVNLKLSLLRKQEVSDFAVLNYDVERLRLDGLLKSKVIYFSESNAEMNTKSVQNIYPKLKNNKSDQYLPNLLASLTAIELLGLNPETIASQLPQITQLPARLELIGTITGVKIYNDIKSTTPWATLAAILKLKENIILICGGRVKGIDYEDFARGLDHRIKQVIIIKSELSDKLVHLLTEKKYKVSNHLKDALEQAFLQTQSGDKILVSPAAGFFYTNFIKGKKSLRRLITSLPPKEQV